MQKSSIRRAKETRWLYRLEARTLSFDSYANQERSMLFLQTLTKRLWKREAPQGRRLPSVRAGRGILHGKTLLSFCLGYTEIVLARNQRTILVLLHELTHALGPCVHGEKFIRIYFKLLHRYAGYNRWFLQQLAEERGIML